MAVLALGISFRRAPIDLLERLAFTEDDLVKAYRRVQDMDGVDEAVVLSTCNRVEIYGSVPSYHAGFLTLKRLLTETRGVAGGGARRTAFTRTGNETPSSTCSRWPAGWTRWCSARRRSKPRSGRRFALADGGGRSGHPDERACSTRRRGPGDGSARRRRSAPRRTRSSSAPPRSRKRCSATSPGDPSW